MPLNKGVSKKIYLHKAYTSLHANYIKTAKINQNQSKSKAFKVSSVRSHKRNAVLSSFKPKARS